MCLRIEEHGFENITKVLSGVSEHGKSQQAFYMEDSAEIEKLELFGMNFC